MFLLCLTSWAKFATSGDSVQWNSSAEVPVWGDSVSCPFLHFSTPQNLAPAAAGLPWCVLAGCDTEGSARLLRPPDGNIWGMSSYLQALNDTAPSHRWDKRRRVNSRKPPNFPAFPWGPATSSILSTETSHWIKHPRPGVTEWASCPLQAKGN